MYLCKTDINPFFNSRTICKFNGDHVNETGLIQSEQKGWQNHYLDPHIQNTPSLNGYCLVDATELRVPEQPDTGTVSSLKQSISWTLDNNLWYTHYLYTYLPNTH